MTVLVKNLCANALVVGTSSGAATALYSATAGGVAQIDQITAYNNSGSACTLYCYITPSGVAPSATDPVVPIVVPAYLSVSIYQLIGHKIPAGGALSAWADVTNVIRVTASGAEFS